MSCSHALTIERETTETNNQESHFVPTVTELKYGILYFAGLSNITLTKPNAFFTDIVFVTFLFLCDYFLSIEEIQSLFVIGFMSVMFVVAIINGQRCVARLLYAIRPVDSQASSRPSRTLSDSIISTCSDPPPTYSQCLKVPPDYEEK